jgi:probable HAF family extracellular repeat protein
VVGSSYTRIVDGVEQAEHAFLWENGVLTDLGVLPDDAESATAAVNSFGFIVGSSQPHQHGHVSRNVSTVHL